MTSSTKTNRHSIYFGWYILGACVILLSYQSVTFVYGLTSFMTPIAVSLSWSYAQISFATSLRGIEVGVLDPLAGMVIDRWPARRLMLLGTVIYALGVVLVSQSSSLLMFYLGFLIMGLGGTFCYSMVPQTVLARWFKKNIGKASAIFTTGYSIGGILAPLVVKGIDAYGWRELMLYFGFGVVILGVPLSLLFRDKPEDYGLLADGAVPVKVDKPPVNDPAPPFKQVLKMRAFWLIGLAAMFQMMAVNALTIHIVPYLTSLGMLRATAAISITIFSFAGFGVRLLYGVLADIFPKKYIWAFSSGITVIALMILQVFDGNSFAFLVLFSLVYSFGVVGATTLRIPMTRDYFGVKNFGTIFGWQCVFTVIGGIVGAPLAGWMYDAHGTYFPIWFIFAGFTAVGTVLLLLLPSPKNTLKLRTEIRHA